MPDSTNLIAETGAMRIAFITEYQRIGGGESNLLNLCEALSAHANVTLYCGGLVYQQARERGIDCRQLNIEGKRWLRALPLVTYPAALRRELASYDVVHAYSLNVLPRLTMFSRPLVWTTHGFWERPFGWRARIIDLMVERVVAVSNDVLSICRFSAGKARRIFLGTNFSGASTAPVRLFDPAHLRLVCVGRFQDIKGQDLLITAVDLAARARPSTHFTVELLGDVHGELPADIAFRERLRMLAAACPPNVEVRFEGFQSDVATYLHSCDFSIVPSRYESFSMAAIEALACGKPVLAPAIGGPRDIIDRPEIGRLFEAGNVTALRDGLMMMIDGFGDFSAAACRARAADFSVQAQAAAHLALYKELSDA